VKMMRKNNKTIMSLKENIIMISQLEALGVIEARGVIEALGVIEAGEDNKWYIKEKTIQAHLLKMKKHLQLRLDQKLSFTKRKMQLEIKMKMLKMMIKMMNMLMRKMMMTIKNNKMKMNFLEMLHNR